jgi:hypothetical protein
MPPDGSVHMNFHSFAIVLMVGIMLIGGGILIAMLVLESPWQDLRSWLGYASASIRRLRRRLRQNGSREKKLTEEWLRAEEEHQRPRKTVQQELERTKVPRKAAGRLQSRAKRREEPT